MCKKGTDRGQPQQNRHLRFTAQGTISKISYTLSLLAIAKLNAVKYFFTLCKNGTPHSLVFIKTKGHQCPVSDLV